MSIVFFCKTNIRHNIQCSSLKNETIEIFTCMIYKIRETTIERIIRESDLKSFLKSNSKGELNNLIGKPLNLVLIIETKKLNPETRLIIKKYKKNRLEGQIQDVLSWDLYSDPKIIHKSDEGTFNLKFNENLGKFFLEDYGENNIIEPYKKNDYEKLSQFKRFFYGEDMLGTRTDMTEKWSQKYKKSINCKNPKGFSQRAHCQGKNK